MSVAQRELPVEAGVIEAELAGAVLKQQVAERLAAHRQRRVPLHAAVNHAASTSSAESVARPNGDRSQRVAAAVAERYAQQQSYRSFLAAEAARAVQQAEAAAEIAARNAQAIAEAHTRLLAELADAANAEPLESGFGCPAVFGAGPALVVAESPVVTAEPPTFAAPVSPDSAGVADGEAEELARSGTEVEFTAAGLRVRLYEDVGSPAAVTGLYCNEALVALDPEECSALDREIDFRQSPVFEDRTPPEPLPANVIHFPRQLVAARKSRPRIAEGPLRDDAETGGQLRIFEVTPELPQPLEPEQALPEWSSIRLEAHVPALPVESPEAQISFAHVPETAPIYLRLMATAVDGIAVLGAFLGFVTVAALIMGEVPRGPVAAISAGGTLVALAVLYYVLSFSVGDQTPGMRYARVGFCTFSDENPTRPAVRRRLLALVLAALPLGMGLLWTWMDDDRLGWHDRISRMYPRAY
jgi:hypothetical protein